MPGAGTGVTAAPTGWRAIIGSSAIMSLALLGDALLYAVLPAYAEAFGLTLPWVGVMLSANRFVRVFAYGLLARVTRTVGLRRMCIGAALAATLSTALYGVSQGPAPLLAARVLWGLTYGALVLATLSYATTVRRSVGLRVGVGQAIQRLGPILALLCGAWLVGQVGPRAVFLWLAVPTALAVILAFTLPADAPVAAKRGPPVKFTRPAPIDLLFFLQGYGVDGLFALSVALILARDMPLPEAVALASLLLALRHFGEAIAAPFFGWLADRIGARRVFIAASALTTLGFALVAGGFVVVGAVVMMIFRGALAALGPAVIAEGLAEEADTIGPLARMQSWRDLGAACGPLLTGLLLTAVEPELQLATVTLALAVATLVFVRATARA